MKSSEKELTYNIVEVSELFNQVDRLNRENRDLRNRLQKTVDENAELRYEREGWVERLADFEAYYARERTKAREVQLR